MSIRFHLCSADAGWFTQNEKETYSAGVNVTVDGHRLDAHLATGLHHLIKPDTGQNTDELQAPPPLIWHEHSIIEIAGIQHCFQGAVECMWCESHDRIT